MITEPEYGKYSTQIIILQKHMLVGKKEDVKNTMEFDRNCEVYES